MQMLSRTRSDRPLQSCMDWPTKSMAPGLGVVAAAAAGFAMWSGHQTLLMKVIVAGLAALVVGGFFYVFGRRTKI